MEAFEQFVAVYLEQRNYVVSSAVKFPVTRQTSRADRVELQTHGYEVDLVGARADELIMASVKSYLGSHGVNADAVEGISTRPVLNKRYALLNDPDLRREIVKQATTRYGYSRRQVRLALYVGRFAGSSRGDHERRVRDWCARQRVGAGPIEVKSLADMVPSVVQAAVGGRQYRDNPVLVTMKLLQAAGLLTETVPVLRSHTDAEPA